MQKNKSKVILFTLLLVTMILSTWSVVAAQPTVDLGTAGDFVILTKTGISTTGTTSIVGDIGVSPIDHTAITGFDLIGDETTDTFLTSALVTGNIYAANLVDPTPSNIGTSISNMETAFTDAQGRTHTTIVTELGAGDISGMTLTPGISEGLYKWSSGVLINAGSATGDSNGVTLDCEGDQDAIFIFQIGQDLTIGPSAQITLIGDCQASNIFWAVDGPTGVEIGTTAQVEGIILASKAIHLRTGATLNGRALAQTAVTLDANAITMTEITPEPEIPEAPNVTNNDTLNIVSGMETGMEYNLDDTDYIDYNETTFNAIDFSGEHILLVRIAAEESNPASEDATLTFTTNSVSEPETPSENNVGGSGSDSGSSSFSTPSEEQSSDGTANEEITVDTTDSEPTTEATNSDQDVVLITDGNEITGNVVGSEGLGSSWWLTALVLFIVIGLITGLYFYLKSGAK